MYTRQALRSLGVGPDAISAKQKQQLDEDGYFIVEDVLSKSDIESMRSAFERIHAAECRNNCCCSIT
jgi:ectoine hydroxylase-related dioxygenase (phytanoyl-CoA dioxygenase family)